MYTLRIKNNPLFHQVKQLPQKYNSNHPKESNTLQTPDADLKILFTSPKKDPPKLIDIGQVCNKSPANSLEPHVLYENKDEDKEPSLLEIVQNWTQEFINHVGVCIQ